MADNNNNKLSASETRKNESEMTTAVRCDEAETGHAVLVRCGVDATTRNTILYYTPLCSTLCYGMLRVCGTRYASEHQRLL